VCVMGGRRETQHIQITINTRRWPGTGVSVSLRPSSGLLYEGDRPG
jgi:hypothetical protein